MRSGQKITQKNFQCSIKVSLNTLAFFDDVLLKKYKSDMYIDIFINHKLFTLHFFISKLCLSTVLFLLVFKYIYTIGKKKHISVATSIFLLLFLWDFILILASQYCNFSIMLPQLFQCVLVYIIFYVLVRTQTLLLLKNR